MAIINVTDDDIIWEFRPIDGQMIPRFYGTTGNDIITVALYDHYAVRPSIFGGAGNDNISTVPGSMPIVAYGDNGLRPIRYGEQSIGPTKAVGDDILEVGPGSSGKSGFGNDTYRLHGFGESYRQHGPAVLAIDLEFDALIASGNRGFRVTGIDMDDVIRFKDGHSEGDIYSVTVRFLDSNRMLSGQTARLLVGDESEGVQPKDPNIIEWDTSDGRAALKEAAHDYLADADFMFLG